MRNVKCGDFLVCTKEADVFCKFTVGNIYVVLDSKVFGYDQVVADDNGKIIYITQGCFPFGADFKRV